MARRQHGGTPAHVGTHAHVGDDGVDLAVESIQGIIRVGGLKLLATSLNNAMAFGDIFDDADLSITEEQLGEVFTHIEALEQISKTVE